MSGAKQVGIVAAEIYFPRCFVSQSELEKHDGVSGFVEILFLQKKKHVLRFSYLLSIENRGKIYSRLGPAKNGCRIRSRRCQLDGSFSF